VHDKVYASAHLGAKKPDMTFFEKVVQDLSANKYEVLFWDDSESHVAAAKKFGIHAEFFSSYDDFVRIMKGTYEISG
jgi:HAD superfamily hydrolase (TIGR01509 family)